MSAVADDEHWPEASWRLIAESIPHIVWVADGAGRTLFFNQRGADYTGFSAPSVSWADLVHPDDLERATASWDEARRRRTPFDEDVRLRRSDGEYVWHSTRSQPVVDADGDTVQWVGTATDIDDRKRVEQRLVVAQAEADDVVQFLTRLQAAAPVGFGFVDRELRIVRMNDELARFLGAPGAEQVGRTLAEVAPSLWGKLEPVCRHVLGSGEPVRNLPMSLPVATDDQHREWLATFYPMSDAEGIAGFGIIAVDITERLQAEGFRSTVMSQVADGVFTQDSDGRLTYMNRAASKMLGWTEDELRGRDMHDVVHFQRADGSRVEVADCALRTADVDRRLIRAAGETFTRKDGSTFPVAFSSMPLRVGSRTDGISVVFRDISDAGSSTNLVRVLIADADPASTDALTAILTRHEGVEVVGAATTAGSAVEQAHLLRPDVVLVDVGLPDVGGVAATLRIKSEAPGSSVILLALDYDDAVAAGAIAAGCSGVVDKRRTWVDLAGAVRAAYHGETSISQAELQKVVANVRQTWIPGRAQDLTAREREVLHCLTQGLNNRQTATKLGVTVNTVRNHVQRILYKLGVHSRLEAVVLAIQKGLLDEPS